jgi:hypothetical protein
VGGWGHTARPIIVTTPKNMELVALSIVEDGNQSAWRLLKQLNVSDRFLRRMLKRMKYKVYRSRLVYALQKDDFDHRLEFCEWYIGCLED